MNSQYVWMNGSLVETARATVPFLTTGLHYGLALFEGIRAYGTARGPAVFRLREHMERFHGSAKIFGFLSLPYSVEELVDAVGVTIRANGFGECYIRPLLWLADGGWNLTLDSGRPHIGIAVWEQSVYAGKRIEDRGLRANVSSFMRSHPAATMTKAKISGNYVNSVLAKTESQRLGFDEAIMLDPDGYVAECSGANVLIVRDGRLVTPPADAILEGITRATLLTLAGDLGIDVAESRISRDQLYLADEIVVCGTAAEVLGVDSVDGRPVGRGGVGPITRQLQQTYADAVRGRHARSAGWLEYVGTATPVVTKG